MKECAISLDFKVVKTFPNTSSTIPTSSQVDWSSLFIDKIFVYRKQTECAVVKKTFPSNINFMNEILYRLKLQYFKAYRQLETEDTILAFRTEIEQFQR